MAGMCHKKSLPSPGDLPLGYRARQTEAASLLLPRIVVVSCSGATAREAGGHDHGVAGLARSVRVRPALCRERYRRHCPASFDGSGFERDWRLAWARRKILASIAELAGAAAARSQPAAPPESNPRDDAERRQLTVMFIDLVGSTALSTKLDPEDLRSVIGAYHKCVAQTVGRFGGFVARYMGGGVLIYFVHPQAHEDDAERAVRSGLALIEAVGKLGSVEPLQLRIGVGTGLVVAL
jgi:Adenylate and Guanylate cyclase catalytic domain